MPLARRKGSSRAASAAAAAAAARQQWKVGDLVLAKMKGFPPWPAVVTEPKKWGFSSVRKKLLVYFYGTEQIAFCNYADIEAFTEERKKSLLTKRQGKGADFVRAVDEIVDIYEKLKRESNGKPNSGDEGTVSSAENSEGYESKANNKSPEHSSYISQSHQPNSHVSTESHNAFDNGEIPTTSTEGDHNDIITVKNEPTGMISILDQLRQTPLSVTNSSRKRQGDALLQGCAIQRRAPSLRRSRSLSGGYLCKFQNSNTILNGNNSAGDDLIPDAVQEEAIPKENAVREVLHISASRDAPGYIGLLHNGNCEDILSESASLKSEVINMNDGSIPESNCKIELQNGFSQVESMNVDVSLNDKLDLPMKTVIFKRKRKPNRKRVNSTECAKLNQEVDSQVEIGGNLSLSPGSHNEMNKISACVDGDEHLPLVKRARARMSKPHVEETQLDEIICMEEENNGPTDWLKEVSDTTLAKDKPDECTTFTSSANNSAVNHTASNAKQSLGSVTNICTLNLGRDLMFWKANKYHFKNIDLDVEAALPPSKRLHRALEAMSANAAAATEDCSEDRRESDLISNPCLNSPRINPSHTSSEGVAGSHASAEDIPHTDSNSSHNSGSLLPCFLTPQNPEASSVTPEENSDIILNENLGSSSNKGCVRILVDVNDCNGASNPEVAVAYTDTDEKSREPCSSNFIEKQTNAISNERKPVKSPSKEGILMDVNDCNGASNPEVTVAFTDTDENSHEPCSSNFIEKQTNAISNEHTYVKSPSKDGMHHQLPSSLVELNLNQSSPQTKTCSGSQGENFSRDETVGTSIWKPGSVLNSKEVDNLSPSNGVAPLPSSSTVNSSNGLVKASNSNSNDICGIRDMQDVPKEVDQDVAKEATQDVVKEATQDIVKEVIKVTQDVPKEVSQDAPKELKHTLTSKERGVSPDSTRMKDLIAAAQAKRLLSRSSSFPDNTLDGKTLASPFLIHREESFGHGSPRNSTIYRTPASDEGIPCLQNGSRSPHTSLHSKGFDKFSSYTEANAVRKTFEAQLCTLSRTKESIGRATRLAIECAKYGIAGEVVDILLKYLEREPNLYRKVDLFFLVDSITQCSRSQKGGLGDVYPSLVQSVLPRLLIAAAPSGNAAGENRRQCLKVLRVWLERKTLPESIIRHHMRELEVANEASFSSAYSRRPLRTERAINDPVREMEGMLVDEYGSNTGFQLPSFLHSNVLEDDDGSSDDEKCFEAVTPESNAELDDDKRITHVSTEKHRHVLEDVDGELEMEDLAPSCEVEASSTCPVAGVGNGDHSYQLDHHTLPFAPPLPEDKPPSPPPLPPSPPPVAPSYFISQHVAGSHAFTDASDFHLSRVTNNVQNQPRPICQQPSNVDVSLITPDTAPYYHHGYGVLPKQLPPPVPSLASSTSYENLSSSHPTSHTENKNNPQSLASIPLPNNGYSLHPPLPTISNHFSYVRCEQRQTQTSWGNCSSSTDNFQRVHDGQRGNFYVDRGPRGSIVDRDMSDRGRFSGAGHLGPVLSDKVDTLPTRPPYGTLSPTVPCSGWSLPPRGPSYSVPASRPSMENQIPRVAGAPGYWRPR